MKLRQFNAPSASAFTLIEIAISLAVIAFAVVAIIGILPGGLQVQRDNREDTIVNQDGTYLLEAIRNGATGMEDLDSFVEVANGQSNLTSGEIIGLLSQPGVTNRAIMRSISGSAVARGPAVRDLALRYDVSVFIDRIATLSPDTTTDSSHLTQMQGNLHELRLLIRWPVLPNGNLAGQPSRQVFRTLIAGVPLETNGLFFFNPTNAFQKQ